MVLIVQNILNIASIDLEEIKAEFPELSDRRVTGTKIIQCDRTPQITDLV